MWGEVMEVKKRRGQWMEKGVEAAMQELLSALSLNPIRVRRGCVCVYRVCRELQFVIRLTEAVV